MYSADGDFARWLVFTELEGKVAEVRNNVQPRHFRFLHNSQIYVSNVTSSTGSSSIKHKLHWFIKYKTQVTTGLTHKMGS